MDQLIDTIRAAIATDASKEQKAAGVQACRTITAALDTEPGKPIVLPGTPARPPLSGVSLDQVLDLLIGRLTSIANAREASTSHVPPHQLPPAASSSGLPAVASVASSPPGIRRPVGLRVPKGGVGLPAGVVRAASSSRPASRAPRTPSVPGPASARSRSGRER